MKKTIHTPYGWEVEVTAEQFAAGETAAAMPGATHYTVWLAFKGAGVPVRSECGRYPASLAATALLAPTREALCRAYEEAKGAQSG